MESRIRPVNMQYLPATDQNLTQVVRASSSWTNSLEQEQKSRWHARSPIFTMDPITEAVGDILGQYTLYTVGNFSFDLHMPPQVPNVLCLEIVTATNPSVQQVESGSGRWLFRHDVLVIEPVIGNPDVYRRIGVGYILVGLYNLVEPSNQIESMAWDFFQNEQPYTVILV